MAMTATTSLPGTGVRLAVPSRGTHGRWWLLAVLVAAGFAGALATGSHDTALAAGRDGADLVRLLRGMAAIKTLMAAGVVAAILWRLGSAVTLPWLAAYAGAGAALASGPGLIWGLVHVGAGAALLHGGLLAGVVLLWRDPVVGDRLAALVAARRAALAR
jgi:hypothetical protein